MKFTITRAVVWAAKIEDRPAGLAEKLTALSDAGAHLEFILARRAPELPGQGVVFVSPLKGAAQIKAADKSGFMRTDSLHSLRVEGADKPGVCAAITTALAQAELNLRGFSAATISKHFIVYLAFDDEDEVKAAVRILKRIK